MSTSQDIYRQKFNRILELTGGRRLAKYIKIKEEN